MKLSSPDYENTDKEEALEDFRKRIDCYRMTYVPIDDSKDKYVHTACDKVAVCVCVHLGNGVCVK